MTPSAAAFALQLPGGLDQALGFRSMRQLAEPGPDPDSAERLLLELLENPSDTPSNGNDELRPNIRIV
jgi:hypothetical protein